MGRGRGELRGAEPASRGPVGPLLALHARLTDHDNSFRMQSRKHRRAREGIGRPVFPPARGFPRHSLTSDAVPSSREHAYRRHVAKGREREREEGYTGKGDERAPRDEPIARAGTQEANRQNATSERAREGPSFQLKRNWRSSGVRRPMALSSSPSVEAARCSCGVRERTGGQHSSGLPQFSGKTHLLLLQLDDARLDPVAGDGKHGEV